MRLSPPSVTVVILCALFWAHHSPASFNAVKRTGAKVVKACQQVQHQSAGRAPAWDFKPGKLP